MGKNTGTSGGFFDAIPISDDSVDISGVDAEDSNIPPYEDEDEEEEEIKPKKTKQSTTKSKSKQSEPDPDDEDEDNDEEEEEEEEEVEVKSKKSKAKKEDEEDPEDDDSEEDEDDDSDDDISDVEVIALGLIEKGVLVPKEGKQYDPTDVGLAEMFEDSYDAKMQERVAPGYESILAAMELGITADQWVDLVAPDVDVRDADLTDVDTQKILVRRNLEAQGISKEKIAKKIARLETNDELAEEAEEAQTAIVARDEARIKQNQVELKEAKEKQDKEAKETLDSIRKEIYDSKEILGFYQTKKDLRELDHYMTRPVNPKGQTQFMIDRNDRKKAVKAAFILKNEIDAEKVNKVLKSKATLEVKKKLDSKTDTRTSGKGKQNREQIRTQSMSDNTPWGSWGDTNEVSD